MKDRYNEVMQSAQMMWPELKVVNKDQASLMKTIDVLLRVVTFGKMTTFMSGYVTTMGTTVYVPSDWEERNSTSKAVTMRHELVHLAQEKRLGTLLYRLSYVFWVLPCVFSIGRRNLEREAYEETLRAYTEYFGRSVVKSSLLRKHIIEQFTSASYCWMWPWKRSNDAWYDSVVDKIEKELDFLD